jgi:hypothetical protein
LRFEGEDEEEAAKAIVALFESGFGELDGLKNEENKDGQGQIH